MPSPFWLVFTQKFCQCGDDSRGIFPGKFSGPAHDYNSVGNPENYNSVTCRDSCIYNRRLKLHHFNNKVERAWHQSQGARSIPVPTCGDKSATLQHTFHALSVHHIELADVSHGTAVRFSQKTWHRLYRPRKTMRVLCMLSVHSWDVEPIELYFQTFFLMTCFQNKYMDNAIYYLRTKI